MLNTFREIRDEIEQKILDWLEHPEDELAKLREEREQERRERLEAARREAESHNAFAVHEMDRAYLRTSSALPERSGMALV
jgi:elongation factor P--beta-lysine ligase